MPRGLLSCCLSPSADGREEDTDRSIARGANGTAQAVSKSVTAHSTPPLSSKEYLVETSTGALSCKRP